MAGPSRRVGAGIGSAPASGPDPDPIRRLGDDPLTGDVSPVHDPSLIHAGHGWYLFSTDSRRTEGHLEMRCSTDEVAWKVCGTVFAELPPWVRSAVPAATNLWAPDISFFNGLYHLYYCASTFGSQRSSIGLATSLTLDPADPAYRWVDHGEVLDSRPGDDFNAIDPNILVDDDGRVYLNFGSFWSGIKQRQVDPATGKLLPGSPRVDLATRPRTPHDPIEGASIVHHGRFYYLFVSLDACCDANLALVSYKQAVGRATSPRGPYVAADGRPMLQGGATVVLAADPAWAGPGGGTMYLDPVSGESTLAFHALKVSEGGRPYLWLRRVTWQNGWPAVL